MRRSCNRTSCRSRERLGQKTDSHMGMVGRKECPMRGVMMVAVVCSSVWSWPARGGANPAAAHQPLG